MGAIPGSVAVVIVRRRADGASEVWRHGDPRTDAPGAIPTADCRPGENIFEAAARACEGAPRAVDVHRAIELLGEFSRGPGARPRALMRVVVTSDEGASGNGAGEGVWAAIDDPVFDDQECTWIRVATRR